MSELVDALRIAIGGTLPGTLPDDPAAPRDYFAWARWIVATAGELRLRKGVQDATVLLTIDQLEEAIGRPEGDLFLLNRIQFESGSFCGACLDVGLSHVRSFPGRGWWHAPC